ncbi:hypothetical protein Bhyg_03162 [Pseudolycoriella hygida]|uniref:Uncharacterized protein n=1 Tax=Pseudolycoriella hygida TaxID=35572 RepID=A0A9Q0NDK5_9DIPT|nr:hypothetical protein Bhyg_03162 [Pseudolycoriella hygida]
MELRTKSDRKPRVGFTIKKDIALLRAALCKNPWQTAIKSRINLLLQQYRTQGLQSKTGTEEEKSTRGGLLESIDLIIQEESAAINYEIGAEQDEFSEDGDGDTNEELCETIKSKTKHAENAENCTELNKKVIDLTLFERNVSDTFPEIAEEGNNKKTDKERDELMNMADVPTSVRSKKQRLNIEEEMLVKRQEHEMEMEIERLQIERRREVRLEEESRRRDEFAMSQMTIQQKMLTVITKLMEKGGF